MRKINLIWIFALILIIPNTLAYINCTPSACGTDFTDYGVACSGATCVRNCSVPICAQDWTQVHSDTNVGFDVDMVEKNDISSSYTPSDTSKCYNFTYDAKALDDIDVIMAADTVSPDCDTEAIGGFWDDTQRTSPWFSGMNNYIGNVGDPEFDYLVKTMRAHTEEDSDSAYRSNVRVKGVISCAPNNRACSKIEGECDTDCYSRATIMNIHQGYYNDTGGSSDNTLYSDLECGNNLGGDFDFVDTNRIRNAKYIVYESTLVNENSDQSCDRTHEAPSVSNVRVLPEIPNAGQDLLCNYTYSDPENFTEQNSSYEWWKNSVNQNVNSQTLAKSNLTPGEQWYCKATPSDGLLFGTQVQSTNTVTIRNATQNLILYINNSQSWNQTGYFGNEENVIDFNNELNNALANCSEDVEGYCNVSLTFSSNNFGVLNLSDFGVYYTQGNVSIVVSLNIESITTMHSNETLKIFEFIIHNDGDAAVTDVQWWFDTNDSYRINSTSNISSLAANERAFVYLQYNFSDEGSYNVKANATGLSQSATVSSSLSSTVGVGDLAITSFSAVNIDATNVIFEIQTQNNLLENLANMNWSLTAGNGQIINSTQQFSSIKSNETVFIFVNYDYGAQGTFSPIAAVTNGTYSDTKTIAINVKHIEAYNLSVLNESETKRIFEFIIRNSLSTNLTGVNWTLDTKNSYVINSTSSILLQPSEELFIYLDYNFSTTGAFNINATARNGSLSDSKNLTINI